jgi:PTH1 family peptidyl-tRNA hydrolase
VIAVHDDVDLDVGRVRLRKGGRAGGNRGIASIIAVLGDPEFLRVKVGVGRPLAGPVPSNYVLGIPPADEAVRLADGEARAADAVELTPRGGAGTRDEPHQPEGGTAWRTAAMRPSS